MRPCSGRSRAANGTPGRGRKLLAKEYFLPSCTEDSVSRPGGCQDPRALLRKSAWDVAFRNTAGLRRPRRPALRNRFHRVPEEPPVDFFAGVDLAGLAAGPPPTISSEASSKYTIPSAGAL